MTQNRSTFNARTYAQRLYEHSLGKIGTDEKEVLTILEEAKGAGQLAALDSAYFELLDENTQLRLLKVDTPQKLSQSGLFVIPGMLIEEMEGADLDQAMQVLGDHSHQASMARYAVDGISNLVDFSTTSSKVIGIGAVGAIALFPPLLPIALVGGAAFGGWNIGSAIDKLTVSLEKEDYVRNKVPDTQHQETLLAQIDQERKLAVQLGTGAAAGLIISILTGPKVASWPDAFKGTGNWNIIGALTCIDDVTPIAANAAHAIGD